MKTISRNSMLRALALKSALAAAILATIITSVAPVCGKGRNPSPGIAPPNSAAYGKTHAEWSAEFWKWGLEYPIEGHPFLDHPSFDFSARQSGQVWFWAAPDGPLTRTVTMPAGKALFLTLRDVECSSLEAPDSGFHGATEEEQRACARFWADHIVDVFCIIDGVSVENLQAYRVSSPQFEFSAPTPWIFGETGGPGTAVGDGYYLLLAPLAKGTHTIHYGGTFHFDAGEISEEPLDLPKDITIELTVD